MRDKYRPVPDVQLDAVVKEQNEKHPNTGAMVIIVFFKGLY